ncbi:hypothetical protein [Novosphingobium sp. BL-52-GroH]|uniref:hypothetical protein n=1 Tax=Novosphingobium sp. BL-52-GroH TaxID=3349877 RepID=UPI00384C8890
MPVPNEPLARFRRNCWKAIFLIALLRFADAATGLDLLATGRSHAGSLPFSGTETEQ